MRVFISSFLLIAYLALMLKPSLPLVEYELRQSLIAKEFCVNSDNAELNCSGSCYLNKRLKEAAGEQDPTSQSQEEIVVPVHLFHSISFRLSAPPQMTCEADRFVFPNEAQECPPVPPPQMLS